MVPLVRRPVLHEGESLRIPRVVGVLMWRAVAALWATALRACHSPRERAAPRGLRILDYSDEPLPEAFVHKVAEAIELFAAADPRRFARLQYDLDAIAIHDWKRTHSAVHMPGSRTCYLGAPLLREHSAHFLAVVIAHEAAHARLDRLRMLPCGTLLARVEHRCGREELALAARLGV